MTIRARLAWLSLYAIAMSWVESAVVVYLRAIYYPQGFSFPIVIIPDWMAGIEVGREAATLVMLAGVSALAGRDRWERFLCFCICFGVWDIFYYVWLKLWIGWPPSILTWDILFLIPAPWIGPVLAPLVVSAAMIAGAGWLFRLKEGGASLGFSRLHWGLAVAGGMAVLASFMLDGGVALEGADPPPFRWWLFWAGMAMAVGALAAGVRAMGGGATAPRESGTARES